jgi:hypothetical protein
MQEFCEVLEDARGADMAKSAFYEMGWQMFLEMCQADPALNETGVAGSAGAGSSSGASAAAPSTTVRPSLAVPTVARTIEDVILQTRGPLSAATVLAEKIVETVLRPKFHSGEWPAELVRPGVSGMLWGTFSQELLTMLGMILGLCSVVPCRQQ